MNTCVYETDVLFSESTLSYLLEAGPEVKQSALSKMIAKVKELLEKLKRFIQETILNKKMKEVDNAAKKNPKLAEKEVKIPDMDKILKVEEEFAKDLSNAKTVNDVEKAKQKRKKARKIAVVATITITVASALVYMRGVSKRASKLHETYNHVMDVCDAKLEMINEEYAHQLARGDTDDNYFKKTEELLRKADDGSSEIVSAWSDINNRFRSPRSNRVMESLTRKSTENAMEYANQTLKSVQECANTTIKDMNAIADKYLKLSKSEE